MRPGYELLRSLRRRGIAVARDGGRLHLTSPRGLVTVVDREALVENKLAVLELLESEEQLLNLPLSRFAAEGRSIMASVPWWSEAIWFVPGTTEAEALVVAGVARGRIWTAAELQRVAGVEDLADPELRSIAGIKAAFGCTVLEAVALGPAPPPACRACRGTSFWTHADGRQICARCHPPVDRPVPADHPDDPGDGRPR